MTSKISGANAFRAIDDTNGLVQKTKEIILRGIRVVNNEGIDPQNPNLSVLKAIYYAVSYGTHPEFGTLLDRFKMIGLTYGEKASLAHNVIEKSPHLGKNDENTKRNLVSDFIRNASFQALFVDSQKWTTASILINTNPMHSNKNEVKIHDLTIDLYNSLHRNEFPKFETEEVHPSKPHFKEQKKALDLIKMRMKCYPSYYEIRSFKAVLDLADQLFKDSENSLQNGKFSEKELQIFTKNRYAIALIRAMKSFSKAKWTGEELFKRISNHPEDAAYYNSSEKILEALLCGKIETGQVGQDAQPLVQKDQRIQEFEIELSLKDPHFAEKKRVMKLLKTMEIRNCTLGLGDCKTVFDLADRLFKESKDRLPSDPKELKIYEKHHYAIALTVAIKMLTDERIDYLFEKICDDSNGLPCYPMLENRFLEATVYKMPQ